MFAPPSTETLNRFFLLSWLVVLWQVLRLQDGIVFDDAWLPLWSVAASPELRLPLYSPGVPRLPTAPAFP